MARQIASVHVDIARIVYEYSKVSAESAEFPYALEIAKAKWMDELIACLAMRDPALHEYGAFLLSETEEYRRTETERKRAEKEGRNTSARGDSKESAESPLRQTDRSDRQINPPPTPSGDLEKDFEIARKAFPGTRRALAPEWEAFQKKHGKRAAEIIPLLLPAIKRYRSHVEKKARGENRPPMWQNFKTWLHQEGWTAEYPGEAASSDHEGRARAQAHYREHGYFPPNTPSAWMAA